MSILERITTVDKASPYKRVLVYGEPGKGKSIFSASAPDPLILAYPANEVNSLPNHPLLKSKAKVVAIKSTKDLEDMYAALREGKVPGIQTVVIDTISEIQKLHLDELLREAHNKDKNRNRWVPYQADYNQNTNFMRKLVLDYLDLPYHIILVSHKKEEKDGETGPVIIGPYLSPKVTSAIYGMMDLVGFMYGETDKEGNVVRYMQTVGSRRLMAKTRIGGLSAVITNPTFNDILLSESQERESA